MAWRVYRLPGSRGIWHIDQGAGTQILNVRGVDFRVPCRSVSAPEEHPREWIEVNGNSELFVLGGIAVWVAEKSEPVRIAYQVGKDEKGLVFDLGCGGPYIYRDGSSAEYRQCLVAEHPSVPSAPDAAESVEPVSVQVPSMHSAADA